MSGDELEFESCWEERMSPPQEAVKYEATVVEEGRIALSLPFPAGTHVEVLIVKPTDEAAELTAAAESSLQFWNHPRDDEDWNDA